MKRAWPAMLAAMAIVAGCGESGPRLVPVSGTVTINGKPLEGAEVTFLPTESNENGQPGVDTSGPEGNIKPMTRGRAGLVPGPYKVKVIKSRVDPSRVPAELKDDRAMAELMLNGDVALQPGGAPPKKKGTQGREKIEAEFDRDVPEGGGVIDLDVKTSSSSEAAVTKK